jgi:hypothetical protein
MRLEASPGRRELEGGGVAAQVAPALSPTAARDGRGDQDSGLRAIEGGLA